MLFEKNKYYKYIQQLEKYQTVVYVIIMLVAIIIGLATGVLTLIITIPLGMLIAWCNLIATRIRIQEMKWKFDIYAKITEERK